jgi:hypothetical protein
MMIKSIFKCLFGSCVAFSSTDEDKREQDFAKPDRRGNATTERYREDQEEKHREEHCEEQKTLHKQEEERKESPVEREQPRQIPPLTRKQQKLIRRAKKRATQRFTSFVTANKSRLAKEQGLKNFLGERNWKIFCTQVETYRQRWKWRFGGRMECCGNSQGSPCPHRVVVDPKYSLNALGGLHLDHSIEVVTICKVWRQVVVQIQRPGTKESTKITFFISCLGWKSTKTPEKQETRSGRQTSIFAAVTPTMRERTRCAIVSIAPTQRTPTRNARCKHVI